MQKSTRLGTERTGGGARHLDQFGGIAQSEERAALNRKAAGADPASPSIQDVLPTIQAEPARWRVRIGKPENLCKQCVLV